MTNSEWTEAYRALIEFLRGLDFTNNSLILSIEEAASVRMEEEVSEDPEFMRQFNQESRSNLDSNILRPPEPRESFVAAIEVLIVWLRETSALARKISTNLKGVVV